MAAPAVQKTLAFNKQSLTAPAPTQPLATAPDELAATQPMDSGDLQLSQPMPAAAAMFAPPQQRRPPNDPAMQFPLMPFSQSQPTLSPNNAMRTGNTGASRFTAAMNQAVMQRGPNRPVNPVASTGQQFMGDPLSQTLTQPFSQSFEPAWCTPPKLAATTGPVLFTRAGSSTPPSPNAGRSSTAAALGIGAVPALSPSSANGMVLSPPNTAAITIAANAAVHALHDKWQTDLHGRITALADHISMMLVDGLLLRRKTIVVIVCVVSQIRLKSANLHSSILC